VSLNPLAIAHLGIARRPIVAALLGIWDELMTVLAEEVKRRHRGGAGGYGKISTQQERTNKRNKYLRQQVAEEGEIMLILNILASQGLLS
jgi:hypothetical protein